MSTQLRSDEIPTAVFCDAFARAGISANELARRLGWNKTDGRPDGNRVRRVLGLAPVTWRGRPRDCKAIRYAVAVRLCDALDLDYREAGV